MASVSSLRSLLSSTLHTARARATPALSSLRASGATARQKWGGAALAASALYFIAWDPEARRHFWAQVRARTYTPLSEWRENRTQLARKRQLLAHFGLAPRGGDVLELFPGAGGASFAALDSLADPSARGYGLPLVWRGIGADSGEWEAGSVAAAAALHPAVPLPLLQFDSCDARRRSLIELLREIPDGSQQHVLALHGLSPLFTAHPRTLAALSARPRPSDPSAPPPPTEEAELAVVLREIYRVLRPGGRFFFMDVAAHNREDGFSRATQGFWAALRSALHLQPRGQRAPIELAQQLPAVGFAEVHMEQWPDWCDAHNPRRGVRVIRPAAGAAAAGADPELYTPVAGLTGSAPLLAGVAIKAGRGPLKPDKQMGSIFTQPSAQAQAQLQSQYAQVD